MNTTQEDVESLRSSRRGYWFRMGLGLMILAGIGTQVHPVEWAFVGALTAFALGKIASQIESNYQMEEYLQNDDVEVQTISTPEGGGERE